MFLRLFPIFRALEAQLARGNAETSRLEDALAEVKQEVAFWRGRTREWETRFLEADADAKKQREMVADFLSQLRFGRRIYAQSPALPEKLSEEMEPVARRRVQARVLVQQAEAQFRRDCQAYVKEQQEKLLAERAQAATPPAPPEAAPTEEPPLPVE
jgi:chromosome segregation ATPase